MIGQSSRHFCLPPSPPGTSDLALRSWVLTVCQALHTLTEPSTAQKVGYVIIIVSIVQIRKPRSKLT